MIVVIIVVNSVNNTNTITIIVVIIVVNSVNNTNTISIIVVIIIIIVVNNFYDIWNKGNPRNYSL